MTNKYTIGGTVSELTGTLVLQDNGGDDYTITANGAFTFPTAIASGLTYAVAVHTEPNGQECVVSAGNGTVTNNNVTNVSVACDSGIPCNGANCDASKDYCCDPESRYGGCVAHGAYCTQLETQCASAADCTVAGHPGDVCCANEYQGSVRSVSCATTCNATGDSILCDPNLAGECTGQCKAYPDLPGYDSCQ